jgi:ribosomal protein S18 acetylase RimI-like enzyme
MSSSPYGDLQSGTSKKVLSYLPLHLPAFSEALGDLVLERIDGSNAADTATCRDLLNHEIELGNSYPQEHPLDDAQFKAYFFSHDAFVVRQTSSGAICGMFYIKPNFPGRCSHICNGGFVTAPQFRRRGIARLMAVQFQRLGKDLGYTASFFNLVFVSNVASVELWKSLGFVATGRVPHAARLKGHDELVDALQFYKAF